MYNSCPVTLITVGSLQPSKWLIVKPGKSGRFGNVLVLDKICISSLSSVVPIIPVVIPMALDLSDAVSRDLVVRVPTPQIQGL